MLIPVFAGAVAGVFHVLSGPDHLAAVAPLTLDQRRNPWRTGLRWGLGHSSGVLLVGVLSRLLRGFLPLEFLSQWAERLVGIMLVGIGVWGVRRAFTQRVHAHEHAHGGRRHAHIHAHGPGMAHRHSSEEAKPHVHTHAAFAVGTLHGLAGSSHFLAVLPALAFSTLAEAIAYLIAYGVGTVLAMAAFSSALGWMARGLAFGGVQAQRVLMLGCSATAIVVGSYWILG